MAQVLLLSRPIVSISICGVLLEYIGLSLYSNMRHVKPIEQKVAALPTLTWHCPKTQSWRLVAAEGGCYCGMSPISGSFCRPCSGICDN